MSTVDKSTADAVIAGKYDEDGITHIIRYRNAFNGDYAYKLCYNVKQFQYCMQESEFIREPILYWSKEGGKGHGI